MVDDGAREDDNPNLEITVHCKDGQNPMISVNVHGISPEVFAILMADVIKIGAREYNVPIESIMSLVNWDVEQNQDAVKKLMKN